MPPETAFFSKSFVLRHFSIVQESEAREPHLTQFLSSDLNRFWRNESSAELEKLLYRARDLLGQPIKTSSRKPLSLRSAGTGSSQNIGGIGGKLPAY